MRSDQRSGHAGMVATIGMNGAGAGMVCAALESSGYEPRPVTVGQIGLHPRGSPTRVRKALPGHHSPTGQETQRLNQRGKGPAADAQ